MDDSLLNPEKSKIPAYLIAALALGLALRLAVIFSAPVHEVPSWIPAFNDETSHRNHVLFRMTTHRTPPQRYSATEPFSLERGEVEYSQPPMYYLFAAGVLRIVRSTVVLRLVSLACWIAALWIIVLHAPNVKMRIPLLLAGGLLGAGMVPSTTINNDGLLALAVAGIYALTARSVREPLTPVAAVNLGMLLALGAWVKLSALALLPMVAVAGYFGVQGSRTKKLLAAGGILLVALWMTMPLWISRIVIYGGPFTVAEAAGDAAFRPREALVSAIYSMLFPYMELWASYLVKLPSLLFKLALVISGVTLAWMALRRNSLIYSELSRETRRVLVIWTVGAVFSVAAWAFYGISYHQVEARLLIPASPALAVLLGWPLWAWSEKRANRAGWLLVVIMALPYLAWGVR